MSLITKNVKHVKYEKDWQDNLKRLASSLEKVDQTKLETVQSELGSLHETSKKLKTEIAQLETQKQDLGDIAGRHRRVKKQVEDLETNYNGTATKKKESFLGNATNKYDWTTKMTTYYPTTYPDNLYQGVVNGTTVKITEQEAIKLLTRVIKAFQKVESTKFGLKFTASTHTSGTNHLPAIQQLAAHGLKSNEIIGQDAQGQDLSDKGKPANHAHLNRVEYTFTSQYVADADILKDPSATPFTPQSTEIITTAKITNFFAFIDDLSQAGTLNPNFLTELNSDSDILKNVENNTSWKIVPSQKTALEPTKLADYGIKTANDSHTKLYLSDSHDKAVNFTIQEGLKSWIELVHVFFPTGSVQRGKLAGSFTTDPYTQLLSDIADNTHTPHWELPESLADLQTMADQIELDKLAAAGRITNLSQKISEKQTELTTKNGEFTSKDTELTALIQKIITKKREELNKSNIKEFDNQTASGGADNRKTRRELYNLETALCEIRYLENDGDASLESSVTDEDTALTTIADILSKTAKCWDQDSWDSIGWKDGVGEQENVNRPNSERIKLIKENPTEYPGGLTRYYDQLVELEKLVKLTEQQQQIKTDLAAAIADQTPAQSNQEWRDALKTMETGLETAFTDAKITEWKKKKDGQAKFDNTAGIKTLLEKVMVKKADGTLEKVEEKFIEFLKGKDAKLTGLSQLIEHKTPVEVIKLIVRYADYEKLSAEDKKKKKQQLVWTLEKKDGQGKYLEDADLTDEEITNTLYEIAIEKKTLASGKKQDESEDNSQSPNPEKGHLAQYWWIYLTSGVVLVGGLVAVFWKQIREWWNGPVEEPAGESSEAEEKVIDE